MARFPIEERRMAVLRSFANTLFVATLLGVMLGAGPMLAEPANDAPWARVTENDDSIKIETDTSETVIPEKNPKCWMTGKINSPSDDCIGALGKILTNSIGMKLVLIPAGEFMMGNSHTAEEEAEMFKQYGLEPNPDSFRDEYPRHRVRITKPFYMGACHVTVGQFRQFVSDSGYKTDAEKDGKGSYGLDGDSWQQKPEYTWRNPNFVQTDDHPAVTISWNDAMAFCNWLSRKEGQAYRLPTEAEWEYACRAGTTTRYSCGDDPEGLAQVGNVGDVAAKARYPALKSAIRANDGCAFTAPAGTFRPNAFGLYDMHGNAWQWCADWYGSQSYAVSPLDDPTGPSSGELRVTRGGSWYLGPDVARSAKRYGGTRDARYCDQGFRVARTLWQGENILPASVNQVLNCHKRGYEKGIHDLEDAEEKK
jgi:formylglycine-generating enzyme required for sulfatase activity